MNQLPLNYSVIIVDDNVDVCKNLQSYIEKYRSDYHVLKTCNSFHCALESVEALAPDLVLLNINLGSKFSFELLNEIKQTAFELIFITDIKEHALTALKYNAIDYLLKPICNEELNTALNKAKEKIFSKKETKAYDSIKYDLVRSEKGQNKIVIPEANGYEFVYVSNVIRCEGWSKYTKVFLLNGNLITSSFNLGHYRKLLAGEHFFHCHKSHLINTKHIQRYINSGTVYMRDGSIIPVSRRKKEEFVNHVIKKNFFFTKMINKE